METEAQPHGTDTHPTHQTDTSWMNVYMLNISSSVTDFFNLWQNERRKMIAYCRTSLSLWVLMIDLIAWLDLIITLKSHFTVSTLYLIFALRPFPTLKTFCQLEILRVKNSFIFQPSKSCCVNNSSKFCSKVEHFLPYLVHLSFEILYQRQLKNVHYTFNILPENHLIQTTDLLGPFHIFQLIASDSLTNCSTKYITQIPPACNSTLLPALQVPTNSVLTNHSQSHCPLFRLFLHQYLPF